MGLDDLKKMKKALEHEEAKTYGGAPSRTPKNQMLDVNDLQKERPDKRVRWIQTGNKEKAMSRKADGYEVIPESEGGRTVGGLSIAQTSRENYEARTAEAKRIHEHRLKEHKTEVQRAVQGVVRELRDRHGITVDEKRIFIDE